MRVLVLGASGLLGNTVFRVLSRDSALNVFGSIRDARVRGLFPREIRDRLITTTDLREPGTLRQILAEARPNAVINCLSAPRADLRGGDTMKVVSVLSVLPQRLSVACAEVGARLVHISSDGVFSGSVGGYGESDMPDADDLYGVAKLLGEVRDRHAISIRTSIIGHEISEGAGLLEWFLGQQGSCTAYRRVVFSGLPTTELARVIHDAILPNLDLYGVYHVASAPISKYDLLRLVADVYGKRIELVPDDTVVIDRSLNASRFGQATGYEAADWPSLVHAMHADRPLTRHTA